jgi:hypothetical protein
MMWMAACLWQRRHLAAEGVSLRVLIGRCPAVACTFTADEHEAPR